MECRFRAGRSHTLVVLVYLMHLAAVAALFTNALPVPVALLVTPLLGMHLMVGLRHASRKAPRALVAVDFDDTGALIELNNGRRIPATVSEIYCLSWLQVVGFQRKSSDPGPLFWLVVLPDSADAQSRRELRACLLTVPLRQPGRLSQARG